MPILETRALSHVYSQGTPFEKTAVHDISLAVEEGELVGVIGHTGSGKSTFIQHLNGLLKPSAGQVLFRGQDIHADKAALRAVRFGVGLVFQYPEYQLFEETVFRTSPSARRTWGWTRRRSGSGSTRPRASWA